VRRWPWLLAAGLLMGCAGFQSRPIEPARVEAGFRGRSLTDPELRAWVAGHLPPRGAPPPDTVDLAELTLVALFYHPDLDVARARVELAEAAVITAGARPNPGLGVGPRYNFDAVSPKPPWTSALSVDLPIETAGKRGHRIARAERLTEVARLELAEAAWQVRSRVRAALASHLFAVGAIELLDAEEGERAELVAVMERRLAVGDVPRLMLDTARVELAGAKLATRAAGVRLVETRAALAAALGLPVAALDDVSFAWPDRERPPAADALAPAVVQRAGLINRLDMRRALVQYDATETALRLEIAKQYPDVRLGGAYSWDQGDNKFGIGLSITLPVLDRNEGPIAEAEARRQEAAARFLALQTAVIGELEKAVARYRAVLAELAEAEATLGTLNVRERTTRRAIEVGEADRPALLAVRVERAAAARARLDALRKVQVALGELEDAVQQPLDPEISLPETPLPSPRDVRRGVSQ
jgi:outer membrane protein TolC